VIANQFFFGCFCFWFSHICCAISGDGMQGMQTCFEQWKTAGKNAPLLLKNIKEWRWLDFLTLVADKWRDVVGKLFSLRVSFLEEIKIFDAVYFINGFYPYWTQRNLEFLA
jgi:hypothetical protein